MIKDNTIKNENKNKNKEEVINKLSELVNKNISLSDGQEADDTLKTFLTIMKELAYNNDHLEREDIYFYVSEAIYAKSSDFGVNREKFIGETQ